MKNESRWGRAFCQSGLINVLLVAGGLWYMYTQEGAPIRNPDLLEVTIGSEVNSGNVAGATGAQGPAISAPTESNAIIPPAPASVAEAEQAATQAAQAATTVNGPHTISTDATHEGSTDNGSAAGAAGTIAASGSSYGTGDGVEGHGANGSGNGAGSGAGEGTQAALADNEVHEVGSLTPISTVPPVYPETMRRRGVGDGRTVVCLLVVEKDGSVSSVSVVQSSGYSAMDTAAMRALYQWSFQPVTSNGVPIRVTATQAITFRLQ